MVFHPLFRQQEGVDVGGAASTFFLSKVTVAEESNPGVAPFLGLKWHSTLPLGASRSAWGYFLTIPPGIHSPATTTSTQLGQQLSRLLAQAPCLGAHLGLECPTAAGTECGEGLEAE